MNAIDLDQDHDLDYMFSFHCGEGNCLQVYINIDGALTRIIHHNIVMRFKSPIKSRVLDFQHSSAMVEIQEFVNA